MDILANLLKLSVGRKEAYLHIVEKLVSPIVYDELKKVASEVETALLSNKSVDSLGAVQNQRIKLLLKNASEKSKFYKHRMNKPPIIDGRSIQSQVKLFPSIDGETLLNDWQYLIIEELLESFPDADVREVFSSGTSTGIPKRVFKFADESFVATTAVQYRYMQEYTGGKSKNIVVLSEDGQSFIGYHIGGHFYQHQKFSQIFANLRDDSENFGIEGLIGSPVSLRRLAQSILRQPPNSMLHLDFVISTYDYIDNDTRQLIKKAFGKWPLEIYSMSEASCPVAWQCKTGKGLHVNSDYFILEILDLESDHEMREEEVGEITITDLGNRLFPLIRYRTGDLAYKSSSFSCNCGSTLPLISPILGRRGTTIKINREQLICDDFYSIINKYGLGVGDFQIELGSEEARIKYIEHNFTTFGVGSLNDLRNEMARILGRRIKMEAVDEIDGLTRGKFRYMLSI